MNAEDMVNPGNTGMSDEIHADAQLWVRSIVDRHAGSLTRYACTFTGDADIARDLVQETFLRLCREDINKIRDHVVPWLFKVCRSRALDHCRKEGRMNPLEDATLAVQQADGPTPSEQAETTEASSLVFSILETLPTNQQEVIRLKFQNGLSYKEIADVTELSVSNVGFLLHTALKTLRQKIGSQTDLLPKTEGGTL